MSSVHANATLWSSAQTPARLWLPNEHGNAEIRSNPPAFGTRRYFA
jgi:hypothetical protein